MDEKHIVKRITVRDKIGEVVETLCTKYCKYPDIYDEEKEEIPLAESDICKGCPLNNL